MAIQTQIIWFRQDLRLIDQAAVAAAAKAGPVIALYIHDEALAGDWTIGQASRYWLHHSLHALDAKLAEHNVPLTLRKGAVKDVLKQITADLGSAAIHVTRHFEPWYKTIDSDLQRNFKHYHIHPSNLIYEPEDVLKKDGTPFRIFTPFYNAVLAKGPIPPLPVKSAPLTPPTQTLASDHLADWRLLPVSPNWAQGFHGCPGHAENVLAAFKEHMLNYSSKRNRPDLDLTSRLSPHLHFGEISARRIWHELLADFDAEAAAPFLRQLLWRDFSYTVLHTQPNLADINWNSKFNAFPWTDTHPHLADWKQGRTGFPIVDAAMRQLWQTGWMHNRLRMIVASFLTKDMRVHWRIGAKWFWDTLVDADFANNTSGWQWVAGCGVDAAPYFRIFNPVTQGEKFDPQGDFIRAFIPELAPLPANIIHKPWLADQATLRSAQVTLGVDYPLPILDHGEARRSALSAYQRMKQKPPHNAGFF